MDLDSIRIFLRVVERGSFTADATQLDMPLSRVSRKVRQLEDDLGVQLLYRTTRRVSVTEAGRDYYERCLTLLRPGGVILVDNVLWGGSVINPADQSDDTAAIRAFNEFVHGDERVHLSLLPIGDGLTLAMKR